MPVCAIYARVSTDKQGESVSHQISLLKDYVKHRGSDWIINEAYIYRDDAVSGTMITKRTAIQQMMSDARQGLFDTILFKGISRFSRDLVDAVNMLRIFRSLNVRVISYEENYDSSKSDDDFLFTIYAAVAQQESQKIGIRVRLGQYELAKKGKWIKGIPPIGYDLDSDTKVLVINDKEAPIVQMIFDLYTNRSVGMKLIAQYLNERGYRTKFGRLWSGVTVGKVLKNEAYTGVLRYGDFVLKTEVDIDNPSNRKKVKVKNPKIDEIVIIPDAHEAIVDKDTFNRAQSIVKSRHNKANKGGGHLLTGLLVCPKCGNGMFGQKRKWTNNQGEEHTWLYYICITKFKYGKDTCDQQNFNGEKLENMVVKFLQRQLAGISKEEAKQRLMGRTGQSAPNLQNKISTIEKQISDIKSQIVNANMKNAKGIIDDETLSIILTELGAEKDTLEQERIDLVRGSGDANRNGENIDQFAQAIEDVMKLREVNGENRDFARVVLHRLVKQITVRENNRLTVKLRFPMNALLTSVE